MTVVLSMPGNSTACATAPESKVMTPVRPATAEELRHAARLAAMDLEMSRGECDRLIRETAREGRVSLQFLPASWRARCQAAIRSMLPGLGGR